MNYLIEQFMNYLLNLPLALMLQRIIVIVTNVKLIRVHIAKKLMMDLSNSSRFIILYPLGGDGGMD